MITRRSFVVGAAWAAALPTLAHPYDKPLPTPRSKVMTSLPNRVVAGYWTHWGSPVRLRDVPAHYNTVFLFYATPVGGAPGTTGAVQWNDPGDGRGAATHFTADLAEFRRTRTAILTVGGAQANVDISTRARAQAFLDSIERIYGELGGFDGLDWNNYEGDQQPNTEQMIWVSQQLKTLYGQDFAITSPPAPWRAVDMAHCRAMIDAGVLDMVSPQYYDGPDLAAENYIVRSVDEWVVRMGDAGRVGVGFGLSNAANYSTRAVVEGAWKTVAARHPGLRGAFNWNVAIDESLGWPFATDIGPLVSLGAPVATLPPVFPIPLPTPRRIHTVVAGDTLSGIATRLGIADWKEIAHLNDDVEPEGLRPGQRLTLPDAAGEPAVPDPAAPHPPA